VALLFFPLAAQGNQDPARALKSKDVAERLAAVETLRTSADPSGDKLLVGALGDRDLEVIEKAAAALADRGSDAAVAPLVRLCIDGEIRRARRTAARTLAKISPVKSATELAKLTSGKNAVLAFEALAVVAPAAGDEGAAAIQRGLRSKDASIRRAAAAGIAGLPDAATREVCNRALTALSRSVISSTRAALALTSRMRPIRPCPVMTGIPISIPSRAPRLMIIVRRRPV
jgi:HEAT repeat protein